MGYARILTIEQQGLREKIQLRLGRTGRTAIVCMQQVELPPASGKVLGKKCYLEPAYVS
jgi:hypothetical protein